MRLSKREEKQRNTLDGYLSFHAYPQVQVGFGRENNRFSGDSTIKVKAGELSGEVDTMIQTSTHVGKEQNQTYQK